MMYLLQYFNAATILQRGRRGGELFADYEYCATARLPSCSMPRSYRGEGSSTLPNEIGVSAPANSFDFGVVVEMVSPMYALLVFNDLRSLNYCAPKYNLPEMSIQLMEFFHEKFITGFMINIAKNMLIIYFI